MPILDSSRGDAVAQGSSTGAHRRQPCLVNWMPWLPDKHASQLWADLLRQAARFLPQPEEAATCGSCAGDCCEAITHLLPGGWRRTENLGRSDMDFTHMEMLALGAQFLWHLGPEGHEPCVHHDPSTGCRLWEKRPPMCRGYYCFGEYWRPRPDVLSGDCGLSR